MLTTWDTKESLMTAPRILTIDGSEPSRSLVRVTLSLEGYEVVEAEDGATALAMLESGPLDLILQDLILPDISGIELVRLLRGHPTSRDIPIIAVSGFQFERQLAERMKAGFTDLLFKPVDAHHLASTVKSYIPIRRRGAISGRHAHILLADDDPVQLKLARLRLEQLGYEVTTAGDGRDALEAVQRTAFDAVVADVIMPGLDGFQLCIAMKHEPRNAHVPILLTSNVYPEAADRELARTGGASDLVLQTLELNEVAEGLAAALAGPVQPAAVSFDRVIADEYLSRVVHQLKWEAQRNLLQARRLAWLEIELSILARLPDLLDGRRTLDEILTELLSRCLDGSGLSAGALFLLNGQRQLELKARLGLDLDLFADAAKAALAIEALGPLESPVLISQPFDVEPLASALNQTEVRSLVLAPVRIADQPAGYLLLATTEAALHDDWTSFARAISHHMSTAIAQAQARSQLAESEQVHRAVVESLTEGVTVTQGGRRVVVNDAYLTILGLAGAIQAEGQLFGAMIIPQDRPVAEAALERTMRGEAVPTYEVRVQRPSGELRLVEVSARPISYRGEPAELSVLRDITEGRQSQDALAQS
jgi:PAS domain S-box-containing protein